MRSQFLLSIVLVLAFGLCAVAQVTTADVVGRVTDTTGAVLPGVMVVIENLGTGAIRTAVSSDSGDYVFNLLPAGRYTVKFELPGFKTFTVESVMLAAEGPARLEDHLEVGQSKR